MTDRDNKKPIVRLGAQAGLLVGAIAMSSPAFTIPLINGLGGEAGFGQLAMNSNDDGSSGLLDLNFNVNFFGTEYGQFYINNNGNITFNAPQSGYTPQPFPASANPMIAPYWADVDTRGTGGVFVAAPNEDTAIVTWNNVGYYSRHTEPTNNFQLVLRDRSGDTGVSGDFDIEFRYDTLNWTTGDASGGTNGHGGIPAQAGFDAGDGENFFVLPNSFTSDVVNLQDQSNVEGGDPGLWSFAIRNGSTPGETPENPLLPVVIDGSYVFEFDVEVNETVFIDPEVAIGYDYEITHNSSPLFTSVTAPTGFGDDIYELWLWDDTESEYRLDRSFSGGSALSFGGSLDRFRILGIEETLGVNPNDPLAFVTGLTFDSSGIVEMSQTPIVFNTDSSVSVPEPASLTLLSLGLIALGYRCRQQQTS